MIKYICESCGVRKKFASDAPKILDCRECDGLMFKDGHILEVDNQNLFGEFGKFCLDEEK
jgi:hypothetical protein